jgi:hypothetical protein
MSATKTVCNNTGLRSSINCVCFTSDFFDDILAKPMVRRQWDQLYTEGNELLGLAWKSSQQHSMVRSA